jgi:hypothetical protein
MQEGYISIEEICRKILKNTVLDIFYLIVNQDNISKTTMAQKFQEYDPQPNTKMTKYRSIIDTGVAMLEGAQLIESWKDGVSDIYCLTTYGEYARAIMSNLIDEDQVILRGSRITKKVMEVMEVED